MRLTSFIKDTTDPEDGTLNFSNGISLDYALTDYDSEKPHRIAGCITMHDQGVTAPMLENDAKCLQAIAYILRLFPDAYLEIIQDEYQEYIFYLNEKNFKTLILLNPLQS